MSEENKIPYLNFEIHGDNLRVISHLPQDANFNSYMLMLVKLTTGQFNDLIGQALSVEAKNNSQAEEIRKMFEMSKTAKPVMSPIETLKG